MNRLDSRTVEFTTTTETTVKERFEELLDDGKSICLAAGIALDEKQGDGVSPSFQEYLSEGTVFVLTNGMVLPTLKGALIEHITQGQRQALVHLQRQGMSYADAVAEVRS